MVSKNLLWGFALEDKRLRSHGSGATRRRRTGGAAVLLFLAALIVAAGAALAFLVIVDLKQQVTAMQAKVDAAAQQSAALSERVSTIEQTAANLPAAVRAELSAQADEFEKQIINSGSALLKSTIALAKKEMVSFGTAGHRFNMVEFDRRSCPQGGVFSGENPNGQRIEKEFEPSAMIEVRESHGDVRGIPFYRVTIDGNVVTNSGNPSQFRHGSMRIACN